MPWTIDEKSSSNNTIADDSLATSVPLCPIAIPICADFNAGASFTPSHVIATKCHCFFSRLMMISFSSGATLARIFAFSIFFSNSFSDRLVSSSPKITYSGCLNHISLAIYCAVVG